MSGPCLCGDPQCPSCGVAQGTYEHPEEKGDFSERQANFNDVEPWEAPTRDPLSAEQMFAFLLEIRNSAQSRAAYVNGPTKEFVISPDLYRRIAFAMRP